MKSKILTFVELVDKVAALKKAGKTVVQSHGIFDLIHPGIIQHLRAAKEQADVLVVTIIKDKDVRRGPGRPIFPENLRLQSVSSLAIVDYVALVDDAVPFECVALLKPDIFAKGQTYMERDREIHDKLFVEERELHFGKTRILETQGVTFSASQIINNFLDIYPEETKNYLRKIGRKYSFNDINQRVNRLKGQKILLVGDGIIDEYHYCTSLGKSAKSHLVVSKYIAHEVFAGGAFAIANHLAGLSDDIHLVTMLGRTDDRESFVRDHLLPNVTARFFYREDGPTVIKKRYLNQYLNQKLFEVNYLNDTYIGRETEDEVIGHLEEVVPAYDLVLVSDFGHGFITPRIIRAIERLSKKVAVNTQTNAANAGFNMVTKYRRPYFVCLDETEVRWAAQARFDDIEEVARKVKEAMQAEYLIVTLGKSGSIGIGGEKVVRTPIFSSKVVDTVGAGDAFFAFTAPCLAQGMPLELVSFIGNAVGALAVQIMGNKKPVEKHELLEFVCALLK